MAAFNDVMTPGIFDNVYYLNLQRALGLLASDQALESGTHLSPRFFVPMKSKRNQNK